MSKKLLFSLFIAMAIAPFSFAQDDNADMQDDSMADEQTTMEEQTDEATADTEAPIQGVVASTKYLCELQGVTRRVEINYETPDSTVPCSVNYYKDTEVPGEVNTLWTANNQEGYCEEKAAAFVDKLRSWGWSCQDN